MSTESKPQFDQYLLRRAPQASNLPDYTDSGTRHAIVARQTRRVGPLTDEHTSDIDRLTLPQIARLVSDQYPNAEQAVADEIPMTVAVRCLPALDSGGMTGRVIQIEHGSPNLTDSTKHLRNSWL